MFKKVIQDVRWLVEVSCILASTGSLVLALNYFLAFFGVSMVCKLCILGIIGNQGVIFEDLKIFGFYIDRNFICNH